MSTPPELDRGLWLCQVLERLQYLWIEQVAFGEWEVTTIATHNLSDERVHFHGSSLADALAQCAQWAILDVPSPDEQIRYSVAELPEEKAIPGPDPECYPRPDEAAPKPQSSAVDLEETDRERTP